MDIDYWQLRNKAKDSLTYEVYSLVDKSANEVAYLSLQIFKLAIDDELAIANLLTAMLRAIGVTKVINSGDLAVFTKPLLVMGEQRGRLLKEHLLSLFSLKNNFIVATYHPWELLKDNGLKRAAWQDLQCLQNKLYD